MQTRLCCVQNMLIISQFMLYATRIYASDLAGAENLLISEFYCIKKKMHQQGDATCHNAMCSAGSQKTH